MTRLDKNRLEWAVFGVALVLVLATFAYLLRESLTERKGPPDVVVSIGEPRRGAGGYMVPLTAENRGSETAEEVRVTIELERDGRQEQAVLEFAYLPRNSTRSGWVGFQRDPRGGTLRVAGIGYQAP